MSVQKYETITFQIFSSCFKCKTSSNVTMNCGTYFIFFILYTKLDIFNKNKNECFFSNDDVN